MIEKNITSKKKEVHIHVRFFFRLATIVMNSRHFVSRDRYLIIEHFASLCSNKSYFDVRIIEISDVGNCPRDGTDTMNFANLEFYSEDGFNPLVQIGIFDILSAEIKLMFIELNPAIVNRRCQFWDKSRITHVNFSFQIDPRIAHCTTTLIHYYSI